MATQRSGKGSLTGSKRVSENSVGNRARKVVDDALNALGDVSTVASKVVDVGATVGKSINDVTQIVTPGGYSRGFQSSGLSNKSDIYGGLAFPKQDFSALIPSDLMNPQIELQATEEQLTNGLQTYAGGIRAQQLLQGAFGYIEEIGKTAQKYHKSEIAAIKAATLGVKTQSEIVSFDISNVELDINREKLAQSDQKLVQAKITTTHFKNVTEQLRLSYEAAERKKDIQIKVLVSEQQDVMQKYLSKSMQVGI